MLATAPIVIKQSFNVPITKVWNAITVVDEMQQWFFPNIPNYSAEVGFSTEFVIEHEGRVFPHLWKVLEIIPNQKMVQEWKFRGYIGCANVTYDLKELDNKTILTLTDTIIEPFPQDIPEFKRESSLEGWKFLIEQQLVKYLDSNI